MRKYLILFLGLLSLIYTDLAMADKGRIIVRVRNCDYFIVEIYGNRNYYALLELYRGDPPKKQKRGVSP
jgi:hypothetical protein